MSACCPHRISLSDLLIAEAVLGRQTVNAVSAAKYEGSFELCRVGSPRPWCWCSSQPGACTSFILPGQATVLPFKLDMCSLLIYPVCVTRKSILGEYQGSLFVDDCAAASIVGGAVHWWGRVLIWRGAALFCRGLHSRPHLGLRHRLFHAVHAQGKHIPWNFSSVALTADATYSFRYAGAAHNALSAVCHPHACF